jgi:asparagine synthase (glutamine-hydrolysing)
MCGIAGFIDPSGLLGDPATVLERMHSCISYRGPDDSGTWHDPGSGVGFAFRRLAIMDLSSAGHQPMASESGRYTIIFNGEVFNHGEIAAQLESLGHRFRGHSDTEVMLAAFEQWGIDAAVKRFIGMFAFAVFDRESRSLSLARDRLGKKPLYWGWIGSGDRRTLLFASELWSIRAVAQDWLTINREAIASYLRFLYVPAPLSAFNEIHKVEPGQMVVVDSAGRSRIETYWDSAALAAAAVANPLRCSLEDASRELEAMLRESIRLRMVSDVPLGAFLSGGIDSSTVVALMQSLSPSPIRTYTISFDEQAFNEGDHASSVAKHLGTIHVDQRVRSKDALSLLSDLPGLFDEPFADSSALPTLLVCKLARRDVTVALSGDGGDELFGGYHRYVSADRLWALKQIPGLDRLLRTAVGLAPETLMRSTLATLGSIRPRWRGAFDSGKVRKYTTDADWRSKDHLYRTFRSIWNSPEDLLAEGHEAAPLFPPIGTIPSGMSNIKRFMWIDTRTYLPDDLLCKVDRTSMAVSLEARVPIIDHRIVEWSWRVPDRMLYEGYRGKLLLRSVLSRYVPPRLTERRKMGFGVPIGDWLRSPLHDWASELLSEAQVERQGILKSGPVRKAWDSFKSNPRSDPNHIWALLMLQGWLQTRPADRLPRPR